MICSGRTDDIVIIGGINVLPSAIRDIISQHAQELSGEFRIILTKPPVGSAVDPPLRIEIEQTGVLAANALGNFRLNLESEIRQKLLFKPEMIFVPPRTLERNVSKSSCLVHAYKNKE
jgi:phenylacetate-CoA ligase